MPLSNIETVHSNAICTYLLAVRFVCIGNILAEYKSAMHKHTHIYIHIHIYMQGQLVCKSSIQLISLATPLGKYNLCRPQSNQILQPAQANKDLKGAYFLSCLSLASPKGLDYKYFSISRYLPRQQYVWAILIYNVFACKYKHGILMLFNMLHFIAELYKIYSNFSATFGCNF